jgi:hypothetical protein
MILNLILPKDAISTRNLCGINFTFTQYKNVYNAEYVNKDIYVNIKPLDQNYNIVHNYNCKEFITRFIFDDIQISKKNIIFTDTLSKESEKKDFTIRTLDKNLVHINLKAFKGLSKYFYNILDTKTVFKKSMCPSILLTKKEFDILTDLIEQKIPDHNLLDQILILEKVGVSSIDLQVELFNQLLKIKDRELRFRIMCDINEHILHFITHYTLLDIFYLLFYDYYTDTLALKYFITNKVLMINIVNFFNIKIVKGWMIKT